MVKLLVDMGKVDVDTKDEDERTPLLLAASDRSNPTSISMHLLLSTPNLRKET
jgi:ankyrin repeat protein